MQAKLQSQDTGKGGLKTESFGPGHHLARLRQLPRGYPINPKVPLMVCLRNEAAVG